MFIGSKRVVKRILKGWIAETLFQFERGHNRFERKEKFCNISEIDFQI
jgi:hypothetical protein